MTVLRYQYPKWPGQFDGIEIVTSLGTFDFVLQDVLDVLLEKQDEMVRLPHLYGKLTKDATAATLAKNIEWLKQQKSSSQEIVVWDHATRDWPIEVLEREKVEWINNSLAILGASSLPKSLTDALKIDPIGDETEVVKPYREPVSFEDSSFGESLTSLIYKPQYLKVFCSICDASYSPEQGVVVNWHAPGLAGEKLVCPQRHTLHSHKTRMTKEAPRK